jgi:HlyD family secretion protein
MTTSFDTKETEIWSSATKEVLDTLPTAWTRGLLYFIMLFIAIFLPWAMLSKVDETGTAKGKLEPQGDTIKLDSEVTGTVEKVYIQEGQLVKVGQPIASLDSRLVKTELQQLQEKLEGQKTRLSQLSLLKNQLELSLSAQQRQNVSQEQEKESQIAQAAEALNALRENANLQQLEKLAQVKQAKATLIKNKTDSPILQSRYQVALHEVERYQKAVEEGIISEAQVIEKTDRAKEIQLLYGQSQGEIAQTSQRLAELESLYQQTVKKIKTDIQEATLKLEEQKRSYQTLKHSNQLALLKIQEQLKTGDTDEITLSSDIEQTQNQIKSLQIQITQRFIKANSNGMIFQLPIKKAGAVVQPGSRIAEIAPEGSTYILKAQMPTTQSTSLKAGLDVKLKFDAYPFQDYGIVKGKLIKISLSTVEQDTPQGKISTYQLDIKLAKNCIPKGDHCIALHPGDTATAEVIVRQRLVIDFVIDPIKKLGKEGLKL